MEAIGVRIRHALVEAMKLLHARGLVNVLGGNASARLVMPNNVEFIYITPRGAVKPFLDPLDIAVIGADGSVYEGKPSSEYKMHLEVYRARPDVYAVVHAHATLPVVAAELNIQMRPELLGVEASYYLGGCIGFVEEYEPGSIELARAVAKALSKCNVAVLKSHGVVAVGTSNDPVRAVFEAIDRLEVLNEVARASIIAYTARLAGEDVEARKS